MFAVNFTSNLQLDDDPFTSLEIFSTRTQATALAGAKS